MSPEGEGSLGSPARYTKGVVVVRANKPHVAGRVLDCTWDDQVDEWHYRVNFLGEGILGCYERQLKDLPDSSDQWESLDSGQVSGIEHFRSLLTYHRLKRPPTRIAASYGTTKASFFAYQFKPLLKFLDNPDKRILIADEVGLGKTIEAGYILKELRARQTVERVLILVPSRLRTKWKKEMSSRFDEDFEIIRKDRLLDAIRRIEAGREPDSFRWITSYESVRTEDVHDALSRANLPIDVLIADEAHWMRNAGTWQRRVGRGLCEAAESIVLLTATPVQNREEDLLNLLRLLYPEKFERQDAYSEQRIAHRITNSIADDLRRDPPNFAEAKEMLSLYRETSFGRPMADLLLFRSIEERLSNEVRDRKSIVELQGDISKLSPLGHIMTRTKKRDVQVSTPTRESKWVSIRLTDAERVIYENVALLCRYAGIGGVNNFNLGLITIFRIVASCIPVSENYFRSKIASAEAVVADEDKTLKMEETDQDNSNGGQQTLQSLPRGQIEGILSLYLDVDVDSKLDKLNEVLNGIWSADDNDGHVRRKVVIFSYFPRTVIYVGRKLATRGIDCRVIHGSVPQDDRERAIDDFLEEEAVKVLVSTDVGAEGIDLQKASVVVNYDLPWNPMVVEQRIGRIDRIGQTSERIHIFNFAVEDSIETRVLQRLFEKIEIFRQVIGEPDPIIGEEIQSLAMEALSGRLTADQLEEEIERRNAALDRQKFESEGILKEVDRLISADQELIDEIQSVIGERQLPTPPEIFGFLNLFLSQRYEGIQLPKECIDGVFKVDLGVRVGMDMESSLRDLGDVGVTFARKIQSGRPVTATLSRDAGYLHPGAETIHYRHPLVLYSVLEFGKERDDDVVGAFAIGVSDTDSVPRGTYGFLVSYFEVEGRVGNRRMHVLLHDLERDQLVDDQAVTIPLIVKAIESGDSIEFPPEWIGRMSVSAERMKRSLLEEKNRLDQRERTRQEMRDEIQKLTLLAAQRSRIAKIKSRLSRLIQNHAMQFPISVAEKMLEKAEKEYEDILRSSAEPRPWKGVQDLEIAVGVVQVGN